MLIAHTSDSHLGHPSPGDPQGAERLNSFRQTLATLARHKPDVLLIAGDTFDKPSLDAAVIEEAARSLGELRADNNKPIPVVLIPGNHDPADADRLWATFRKSLGSASQVHVALQPSVVELAEGKLCVEAYPCTTRFSAEPPWEPRLDVPSRVPGAVRVVLAHGTLQGGPVPEGEAEAYPFNLRDVEALQADYVALGHFHGVYPAWGDAEVCPRRFGYCGTHEPDQFAGDAGYVILATVGAERGTELQRLKVGRRQWRQVRLQGPADLEKVASLCEEAKASADPARYVIRLTMQRGAAWGMAEKQRLEALEGALRAVGAHVERRGVVRLRVDVDTLDLQGLPTGALKEALLSLRAELEQTRDDNRREVLTAALQAGWDKVQEAVGA